MSEQHQQIWDNCLVQIKNMVSDQSFRTWFKPIRPVRLTGNVLTIQVPNKFFYEYIESHFVRELKQAVRAQLGAQAGLEYQILMKKQEDDYVNGQFNEEESDFTPGTFTPEMIKNPFVIPGIKKVAVDPQLNTGYRFENYIEGDCNRLARSAAKAVSERPGGTAFNPLVIFGDVGLGKTHLAQAIGNEVLERYPNKNVVYVSSEKFTNQIVQSIRNSGVNELVNFYQMLDVLIVDDIQFLSGKTKTQEIFFHIFNQLHQSGKQLVLTSDRPPKDLDGMQERLISRFKWGLSADLTAPEFETRMAILEEKMERERLTLPQDVKEFICYNIKDNIRELEGVLISIGAQASLARREVNIDLVRDVITQFIQHEEKEVSIDNIKEHVAKYYGLDLVKLNSKSRKREIVLVRQLSMYLAKLLTKHSLKTIGEEFGGRDHTTVLYSCRSIENSMDTDRDFKMTVEALKKEIEMSLS
jgi:chromosomal replication initiator protein